MPVLPFYFSVFSFCCQVFLIVKNLVCLHNNDCTNCSLGPALVFEGEEAMLAAISEDPMSFKVCQAA